MKTFILAVMLFINGTCYGQSTQILKCRVSNSDWNATFVLDAVGSGSVEFKKSGNSGGYVCSLKVDSLIDGQNSISPNIRIEFTRGSCRPRLESLEKELFSHFTIIVDLSRKNSPEGRVQWLRRKQPDICIIEKLSLFDLSGRNTASDPIVSEKKQ